MKYIAFGVAAWLLIFWPCYIIYCAINAWKAYHVNRRLRAR